MNNCSIRLFEKSKLHPSKNFVIDEIENYLATLTKLVISNVQYQRFDIHKSIKLNLSQDYQTYKSHKWDYMSIQNQLEDNSVVTYYYFILNMKQVAENTIEFEIEMDVINTFSFDSTYSIGKYTLSDKTLVKREHKDRLEKINNNIYITKEHGVVGDDVTFEPNETRTFTVPYDVSIDVYDENGVKIDTIYVYADDGAGVHSSLIFTRVQVYSMYNPKDGTEVILGYVYDIQYHYQIEGGLGYDNFYHIEWNQRLVIHAIDQDTYDDFIADYNYQTYKCVTKYKRIIDQYQEGIETYLFKNYEVILYDEDYTNTYYILYKSDNAIISYANDNTGASANPFTINIFADDILQFNTKSSSQVKIYATDTRIPKVNNEQEAIVIDRSQLMEGAYVEINGTRYTSAEITENYLIIRRQNNTDPFFRWIQAASTPQGSLARTIATNVSSVIFYGINYGKIFTGADITFYTLYGKLNINSGDNNTASVVDSWSAVDTSLPELIKCINIPYAPLGWLEGATRKALTSYPDDVVYDSSFHSLQFADSHKALMDRQIIFNSFNPMKNLFLDANVGNLKARDIKYESKMYHSDFHLVKFVYDSFSFPFLLENIDIASYINTGYGADDNLYVRFYVSSNVQSKFMFQFNQYICKRSTQDYDNVLLIDRNNEKALFNNAYINYIRTGGFAFDSKKASDQNMVNGITTALSLIGSIVSFASTPYTGGMGSAGGVGLLTGTAASIVRNVHNAQEQDRAITQKMTQLSYQATTVQGSEDVDVFKAFSGNKAKIVKYELSDVMKEAIWDLFHYCGYATHEQKIPNVKTRIYFNYIQAEIVFDQYEFNEDVAEEIKRKWNEGITFIHHRTIWDLKQEYENFEVSLF